MTVELCSEADRIAVPMCIAHVPHPGEAGS
jgi:hypothetical protein